MALKLINSWITTSIAGAYVTQKVESQPSGAGSNGLVVIMGEAASGPSFKDQALKNTFFSPDQADEVKALFGSGNLVDAFNAISAPSNDQNITGAPNRIWVCKTNQGSKAAAALGSYANLSAKLAGAQGNKIKFQAIASQAEVAPEKSGVAVPAFGATLDGTEFKIRLNGGAEATVTLSTTPADHADQATLIVELNSLLPSGVTAAAGTIANSIKLVVDADAAAWGKGWGKSMELIDSTPGDLAALGLTSGMSVSAAEPAIELQVIRSDISANESFDIQNAVALQIGYQGTAASLTITDTALTTSVTGGSGANLAINLAEFATMSDLVDYINGQTGYSAAVVASQAQRRPAELDDVSGVDIASTGANLRPGRIHRGAYNFINQIAQSTLVDAEPLLYAGVPTPMSIPQFLAGGAKGSTTAADIVDAVAALEGIQVNMIVPLISRDASEDIADGLTESGSTYTIEAVNALIKSHCIKMSTPKLKRNRIAFLSKEDTFANDIAHAQEIAHYRCSMSVQKARQISSDGVSTSYQPWMTATVAAGMQAAGLYKSLVNKYANIISFEDPSGYDSGSPGDIETAIEGGLLVMMQDNAGNKFLNDQTTYGYDTNFVYNSIQAVYVADLVALDLADKIQKAFVGQSLADVTAPVIASFIASVMGQYKAQKLIAASDDAPLGYKNLKVKISGPVANIAINVKLSTSLYFAAIELSISQIESAA